MCGSTLHIDGKVRGKGGARIVVVACWKCARTDQRVVYERDAATDPTALAYQAKHGRRVFDE